MFAKILIANRGEFARRAARWLTAISIATAVVTTTACTASPSEPPAVSRVVLPQPIRIATMPLQSALDRFRAVCLATFPDPDRFNRAVADLRLGFERVEADERSHHQWREGERYLTLDLAEGERDCSFRVAISDDLTRSELLDRIGASLAPGEAITDRTFMAYWILRNSGCRIDYLPASEDLRIFTIMLRDSPEGQGC